MIDFQHIQWIGNASSGFLRLLDQTLLPARQEMIDCRDVQSVWDAIKRLAVRGAPAIGIAAAYGCVIGAQSGQFEHACKHLATSRPTAVNLFWAIDRMKSLGTTDVARLLDEARKIHAEDAQMCRAIGEHALSIIDQHFLQREDNQTPGILTHCNAGALATGGIGTATAGMYLAHEQKRNFKVYADETRPLLQGARLTAWELSRAGIDVSVQCDNMAGVLMRDRKIDLIIVGADRITANGDAANKIGTYSLAVLAKFHQVPFYIAAPSSTFDLSLDEGKKIPIEHRDSAEVSAHFSNSFNPAFDVTPAELIAGIITEKGVISPVNRQTVRAVVAG